MSFNTPVPINALPRIGSLYEEYLFVAESEQAQSGWQTSNVTWAGLLGVLKNLPDTVIFGYGSAELPALGFVDALSGFYAPQQGAVAITTDGKQRFSIGPSGVVQFGVIDTKEPKTSVTSQAVVKCRTRFRENLNIDQDISLKGDIKIYGEVKIQNLTISGPPVVEGPQPGGNLLVTSDKQKFGTGGNCLASDFISYSQFTVNCNVNSEESVIIANNLYSVGQLTDVSNITVLNASIFNGKLNTKETINIEKSDGDVELQSDGDIVTSGDVTVRRFFGDGQGISNLNLPDSIRLKGSIDPADSPGTPEHGDTWYTNAAGTFSNSWSGLAGTSVGIGRWVYYFETRPAPLPGNTWVLGAVSDLQSPYFFMIDLDQSMTGNPIHEGLIRTTNNITTSGEDIVAKTLVLREKGSSASTVEGDSDKILTTEDYVDDRMLNAVLDFPLKPSKYITGTKWNGEVQRKWILTPSTTKNDELVLRDIDGNFSANVITANFLDGRSLDAATLDISRGSGNTNQRILLTRNSADSQIIYSDSGLVYNPVSNKLTTGRVVADITGDVTGNADTVTKLRDTRTIWGQSFNGTTNVIGNLTSVGNILSQGNNTKNIGSSENEWANIYSTTFHGRFEGPVKIGDSLEHTLTDGNHILGGTWNGSAAKTWSIRCTPDATPDYIVVRDQDGSFAAGTITAEGFKGPLTGYVTGDISGSSATTRGNAASATKLQTARTLWGQSFNGTANVSGSVSNTGNITPTTASTSDIGSSSKPYKLLSVDLIAGDVDNNSTSTDKVNNSLTQGIYWEGTPNSWNGSVSGEWYLDPRPESVANKLVLRDSDRNFAANKITANKFSTAPGGIFTGNATGNVSGSSTSVTGNAASATKLQTARTLWGQSFNGTALVKGNIINTGHITPSENNKSDIGSTSLRYRDVYATTFHGYFNDTVDQVEEVVKQIKPGNYITGDPWNGSTEEYWNIYARVANTASSIVLRDENGGIYANRIQANVVAPVITGNVAGNVSGSSTSVTGNAATITQLETFREVTVEFTGSFIGSGAFEYDQSGNLIAEVETVQVPGDLLIDDLEPLPE